MQSSWTSHRVSLMIQMAKDGCTASQIAAALGGVTRNAVIGKLNRVGKRLSHLNGVTRDTTHKRIAKKREPRLPKMSSAPYSSPFFKRVPVKKKPALIALDVGRGDGVGIVDLEEHHCRWPQGSEGETWYCGRQRDGDSSYCEGHRHYASKQSEAATER